MSENKKFKLTELKKQKIIQLGDPNFNESNKELLKKTLSDIIEKYSNYSILFSEFTKRDPNYDTKVQVLKALKFKIITKKPVFKKEVQKQELSNILTFKSLNDVKSTNIFKKLYVKTSKISINYASDYTTSIDPQKAFDMFVINHKKKAWNILGYHGKELIGFVCFNYNPESNFGSINHISIDPKHRGKGYAKEFLKKIENEFYKAKVQWWFESTDEKNIPMQKAFKRYGFKKIRYLYFYIYKPEIGFKKFI